MAGREVSRDDYRFGYQGQFAEKDDETGWNAFELRMFDPVIARWMVPDPARQYVSPYLAFGNNPVSRIDTNGGTDGEITNCNCVNINVDPGLASHVDIVTGNRSTDLISGGQLSLDFGKLLNSTLNNLGDIGLTADFVDLGIAGGIDQYSSYLYGVGYRRGINGNYLLTGRNFSLFRDTPMTEATRPFIGLSKYRSLLRNGGHVLAVGEAAWDTYLFSQNKISGVRYTFHIGSIGMTYGATYLFGGPAGVVVGTASKGYEMWFDGFFKYMDKLSAGIGTMEYQIKNGWNPQYMFGSR